MRENSWLPLILVGCIGGDSVCLRKNGRLGESRHGSVCRYNCTFFTTRRYTSAVFAVVVCPSVCPSVCHKPVLFRNDWTTRAAFWHGGFLLPVPHCVVKKFAYLQKLGYFHLELCSKLRTWKFCHGKSIALSTKLVVVVVDGRACWRHLYYSRRVVSVSYKSINCNPLIPFDLLWSCVVLYFYVFLC